MILASPQVVGLNHLHRERRVIDAVRMLVQQHPNHRGTLRAHLGFLGIGKIIRRPATNSPLPKVWLIELLRTRGRRTPPTCTCVLSAGHLKISGVCPA